MDRGLLKAVGVMLGIGMGALAVGTWLAFHAHHLPPTRGGPLAGVLTGLIFITLGVAEVVRRVVSGPQHPGRHTQETDAAGSVDEERDPHLGGGE